MTRVAQAPPRRGSRSSGDAGRRRRVLVALVFLAPALLLLGALVVYPIVYTLVRSFQDNGGGFVGGANYVEMFTNPSTFTAIRNNVIWVIVAPIVCTVLGLIFAVLMDKIRWQTAFKLIVFMPMAISMLAAGVIFRTMFQQDPQLGVVNAVIAAVQDAGGTSSYPGANVRADLGVVVGADGSMSTEAEVATGERAIFPLTGIRAGNVPESARQAEEPAAAAADEITGTVYLDVIRGGGGTPGEIEDGKFGLPGVAVLAVSAAGETVASTTTDDTGRFALSGLDPGAYTVVLPAGNFAAGGAGVDWLGPALITPVVILAYVWIWAGFAMIMIASGLSAIDRSLMEAARVDGASEWQVFTRVTAPLLMPVLVVVFVTLIINVLKIFDLVYVIPPGASKPAANVIAVEMWTVSFGGGNDQGLGSALAILLLLLVLPSMIINVRRFREERGR